MRKVKALSIILLLPFMGLAQKAPKPYGALPSPRQLKWQEMEMYCLIHFTPTTFQDKEWGYGDAEPVIFNPSNFNANQIAKAAASAGFKGLISVAKHHDGFCLWPSKQTSYNISHSPWKNGKGDLVKEFMQAAHANGLKFGVYLSAWDRNDTRYGTAAYADAYRAELTELMTGYGQLFTSWHDGANGGDGYYGGRNESRTIDRSTYYAWKEKTWPIVRKYQPNAVIFSDIGPDTRWVGNEHGLAGETCWATFTPEGLNGLPSVPGQTNDKLNINGTRNGKYWIPAECDVPLRPGWFYHQNQDDKVKTPQQLFDLYLASVGRGAALDIGLAPTPEGILHERDVQTLVAFGKKLKETFAVNYAKGAKVTASNKRAASKTFAAENILDQDRYSYYAAADKVLNPTLEITLKGEQTFDIIRLRENIKLGQRLDSVIVDIWKQGKWNRLATATSIGGNRLIKLKEPVTAQKLRLRLYAPVTPTLSDFALFKEAKQEFSFSAHNNTGLNLNTNEFAIISPNKLSKALDGNPKTFESMALADMAVIFELKQPVKVLKYLPRQDGEKEGIPTKYLISVSNDKLTWTDLKSGEFSNILANPVEQIITFNPAVTDRYLRFSPINFNGPNFTVAEFKLEK